MNPNKDPNLTPCMNSTKWEELRLLMYGHKPVYKWKTKCIGKDFIYGPDGEWFYHFRDGGYGDLEWVEILAESKERLENLIHLLTPLGLPGEIHDNSVKVFGYQRSGQMINWVK